MNNILVTGSKGQLGNELQQISQSYDAQCFFTDVEELDITNYQAIENFIQENTEDLCASIQYTIIEILLGKLKRAAKETGIKEITVAGGVSANSGLRNALKENAEKYRWNLVIPKFEYTMDNAAMIAITGYFKYLNKEFVGQNVVPFARTQL